MARAIEHRLLAGGQAMRPRCATHAVHHQPTPISQSTLTPHSPFSSHSSHLPIMVRKRPPYLATDGNDLLGKRRRSVSTSPPTSPPSDATSLVHVDHEMVDEAASANAYDTDSGASSILSSFASLSSPAASPASPASPSTAVHAALAVAHATTAAGKSARSVAAAAAASTAASLPAALPVTSTFASPTFPSASPSSSTSSAAGDRPFDPDECQISRWPIFRSQNVVKRVGPPPADKTEDELKQLTFAQWLEYFLSHPAYKVERGYMLSDEQYVLLLDFVTSEILSAAEFVRLRGLDEKQLLWLYHHTADATFQYSVQEYRGVTVAEMDKGPVLVTFREPARKRGDKKKRRKVDSSTAKTQGMQRVCIPFSYIERAVHHCHTGGESPPRISASPAHRMSCRAWWSTSTRWR